MAAETKPQPSGKEAWQARAIHEITCPSGMKVKIKLPNLSELILRDAIPSELLQRALEEVSGSGPAGQAAAALTRGETPPTLPVETVKELMGLHHFLVLTAVAEPEIEEADLASLPEEDLELIRQIATRETDEDAAGVRIGVARVSDFATFREEHDCPEGCEACARVVDARSSSRLG